MQTDLNELREILDSARTLLDRTTAENKAYVNDLAAIKEELKVATEMTIPTLVASLKLLLAN